MEGELRPSRPQATPQSSALRLCRPPLRSALSTSAPLSLQGWGYPSACTCYPPPSPGGVRHVHAAFQRGRATATATTREEASDEEAKHQQQTEHLPDRYRPHSLQPQGWRHSVGEAVADPTLYRRPVPAQLPYRETVSRHQRISALVQPL